MIINVKVDINEVLNELFYDFDPQEESVDINIKDAIRGDIVHQVKREVLKNYSEQLNTKMSNEVKHLISEAFSEQIKQKSEEFVKNGKVDGKYSNDKKITVDEWLQQEFKDSGRYNTLRDIVKNKAEEAAKDLKGRYDLLFASQIISKLNEQDMLKDGVFKALMESTKG